LEAQNRAKKYDSGVFFRGTRKKEHNWPVIPQFRDLGKTANFAHMKIKRLYINNYKSLVDFELLEPNPFSVFVGPNAAGKSNVFEALEFLSVAHDFIRGVKLFGGIDIINKAALSKHDFSYEDYKPFTVAVELSIILPNTRDDLALKADVEFQKYGNVMPVQVTVKDEVREDVNEFFVEYRKKEIIYDKIFTRLFVKNKELVKFELNDSDKLRIDAANLEPVLHRILQDEIKRDEITEWIEYLIPGLDKVEVAKSDLSGDYFLRIFEKHLPDPIGKHLISDGTYNILALLTAVYQSDEPQFLCIEEPENGITPYVQRALVNFFRTVCEEKGHYVWLNTHSPTIVNELQPKELILIDKVEGITKAKQLDPNLQFKNMKLDDAWLTNTLGGGLPW
jgi:predicted ATPase